MEDPHEILKFYETPRCAVVGISPIPKENIVPIFQEDIDKIRLEEVGELEMSLEETTVIEHDPYSPPISIGQPKKRKLYHFLKTPLRYLSNGKNGFNIRGPLDSAACSPSVKPWRPFLQKNPQTSSVPSNNILSQSEVHNKDLISKHENGVTEETEKSLNNLDVLSVKKTSFINIFNDYTKNSEHLENHDFPRNKLETKSETSKDNSYVKTNESHRNAEYETNLATNKQDSNKIEETYEIKNELKKCLDGQPSDSIKETNLNNNLNNQKIEDIEREINKFCNVLNGSEISSPIKILTQSAGQVNLDKVTPNKNLNFDKPKKNSDGMKQGHGVFDKPKQNSEWVQQADNVLMARNKNTENKSSNSFVFGIANIHSYDGLDERLPTMKKVKMEVSHIDSSNLTRNLVNKENNPKFI